MMLPLSFARGVSHLRLGSASLMRTGNSAQYEASVFNFAQTCESFYLQSQCHRGAAQSRDQITRRHRENSGPACPPSRRSKHRGFEVDLAGKFLFDFGRIDPGVAMEPRQQTVVAILHFALRSPVLFHIVFAS
jgi:hypothetical protein